MREAAPRLNREVQLVAATDDRGRPIAPEIQSQGVDTPERKLAKVLQRVEELETSKEGWDDVWRLVVSIQKIIKELSQRVTALEVELYGHEHVQGLREGETGHESSEVTGSDRDHATEEAGGTKPTSSGKAGGAGGAKGHRGEPKKSAGAKAHGHSGSRPRAAEASVGDPDDIRE